VHARRRWAGWIAGAALLLCGGDARAEVRGLSFPVRGMVCPLCTRGVEESLKRLPGVAGVHADLASGRVDVEAEAGQSLNLEVIRQRTARAGFPVNGESDVLARGRFTIGTDGRITFRVTGSTYAWQVLEGQQLRAMFLGSPALKGEYLLGFRLHDRPPFNRPAIAVTRFERLPQPVGRAAGP
jgi:copper chaperone CopZ